jgi:hypothetical protein
MGLFKEMTRVSKVGYIETPSPAGEIVHHNELPFLGSVHHRFILWTNKADNSLNILPKYPLLEYLQQMPLFQSIYSQATFLLQSHIVHWNNYYVWSDSDPAHQSKLLLHQHEVGLFDLRLPESYVKVIQTGIIQSKEATDHLLRSNKIAVREYTYSELQLEQVMNPKGVSEEIPWDQ